MFYHLNLKRQLETIANNSNLFELPFNGPSSDATITDFKDGNIYRNLTKSIGKELEEKRAFTFTVNTDGISKSDKSKCTIWPVFLSINELPLEQRFSLENTVVAGKTFLN